MARWIRVSTRLAVYDRDGFRCAWCDRAVTLSRTGLNRATLDHLIPRNSGGSNRTWNLVTACLSCNSKRGKREIEEWLMSLDVPDATIDEMVYRFIARKRAAINRPAGREMCRAIHGRLC